LVHNKEAAAGDFLRAGSAITFVAVLSLSLIDCAFCLYLFEDHSGKHNHTFDASSVTAQGFYGKAIIPPGWICA
jgi:hypothetical protein